jgi:hypothetical protein
VRRTADVVGRDRVAADGSGLRDGREDLGDRQQEAGHRGIRGLQLASDVEPPMNPLETVVYNRKPLRITDGFRRRKGFQIMLGAE